MQEPVLRWTVTATFVGCALALCLTIGDLSAGGSVGLLFGVILAGIPTFLLWGREMENADLAADRARAAADTHTWTAVTAADDDDD